MSPRRFANTLRSRRQTEEHRGRRTGCARDGFGQVSAPLGQIACGCEPVHTSDIVVARARSRVSGILSELMKTSDLGEAIRSHPSELKDVASGFAARDHAKTVAAIVRFTGTLAGQPALANLLAPFSEEAVKRAFASTATQRLLAEAARLESEDREEACTTALLDFIEALLGQAIIQLVRVQHQTTDPIVEAMGGLRADLEAFREDFQSQLDESEVRVDVQRIREGATGIHLSEGAKSRIWIREQNVTGPESVGIRVGRP